MQESEKRDLVATIESLITGTTRDQIVWTEVNKTTFVWGSPNGGRIVFQRTRISPIAIGGKLQLLPEFQLQAMDGENTTLFSVSTTQTPEVESLLKKLFEIIQTKISQKGIDFLKSLLPKE